MMIDTHTHLYLDQFKNDIDEVIGRAKEQGVERFCLPNIDSTTTSSMLELSDQYKNELYPMMGVHPCSVDNNWKEEISKAETEFEKREYIGVGETGLDYYWDKTFINEQKASLEVHLDWAKEMQLPIILHTRESMDDTIEAVEKAQNGRLWGVFHCFSGSLDQVERIRDLNFKMGLGGVTTYKNGGLDKLLPETGLEDFVLETDAPYLAPVPHRGKRNEPAFLTHVADRIADILAMDRGDVEEITTRNAKELFRF